MLLINFKRIIFTLLFAFSIPTSVVAQIFPDPVLENAANDNLASSYRKSFILNRTGRYVTLGGAAGMAGFIWLARASDRKSRSDIGFTENMVPVFYVVFAEECALAALSGIGLSIGSRCGLQKIKAKNDFFNNQPGATEELWNDMRLAARYESQGKIMKVSAISTACFTTGLISGSILNVVTENNTYAAVAEISGFLGIASGVTYLVSRGIYRNMGGQVAISPAVLSLPFHDNVSFGLGLTASF